MLPSVSDVKRVVRECKTALSTHTDSKPPRQCSAEACNAITRIFRDLTDAQRKWMRHTGRFDDDLPRHVIRGSGFRDVQANGERSVRAAELFVVTTRDRNVFVAEIRNVDRLRRLTFTDEANIDVSRRDNAQLRGVAIR